MKPILILLALGALALPGCDINGPNGPSSTPAPARYAAQTAMDEQALYVVEAGFKGVSLLLEEAVDGGLLEGSRAAKASEIYTRLNGYVEGAWKAYRLGNADNYAAYISYAMADIAYLQAILGDAR